MQLDSRCVHFGNEKAFRDCETFAGIDNEELRLALDDVGVVFYEEDRSSCFFKKLIINI